MVDIIKELINLISFLSTNWAIFLFLLSILAVLIGKRFYGISIFQPIEEIAFKQENYRKENELQRFKSRMISRNLELGNNFLDVLNLEAAKTEFNKALSLDQTNIEAQMGLIKSEVFEPISKKDPVHYDPEKAEKKLNLILNEKCDDKHALLFLGIVYSAINNEEALKYFDAALSSDPLLAIAYSKKAKVYAMQNKNDEAFEMMKYAEILSKWDSTIITNVAYHYLIREEYETAIEKFEFLLRIDPYFLLAYWNISNAHRIKGNFKRAYEHQNKLIELLNNEDVISLERNQGKWFLNTESNKGSLFFDLNEKKCYSYYSMALTCYLMDSKKESKEYR